MYRGSIANGEGALAAGHSPCGTRVSVNVPCVLDVWRGEASSIGEGTSCVSLDVSLCAWESGES